MSETIMEIPKISVKPPKPKTETGLMVQETALITAAQEKETPPDFYCAGNLRIKNQFGDRENTFFISPSSPNFNPEELNTFMHGLNLTQIIPGLDPEIKPKYRESHTSALGHLELGRIEFNLDQPGVKNPFIHIGEKPVRSEKHNIIIYPYDKMAELVYKYQAGIMSGSVTDNNPNFDFAMYRVTGEQLEAFKKQAGNQ